MNTVLIFFTALVASMAITPIMMRLAPRLGMIDVPDPRKVHTQPVPRVGGIGIVLGALLPVVLWLPLDPTVGAYLFGSLVLLAFGVWDDSRELGHYTKFVGQLVAVLAIVYYADVYVTRFPFLEPDTVSDPVARAFTAFALIGMINAVNHSDGLDGLAGGLSILSLGCMAYLAFIADGQIIVALIAAALGGVFGFLRYNTHPARVFMGDGGSQFLGFTLGVLVVLLTQEVNTALSPALPALILGLPIIDILAVFAQRVYHGMNWFRATKNHIHHRLLGVGFDHYEAVVIIYSVQTFFVISAILLPYETDLAVLSIYVVVCAAVFVFLTIAERRNWRAHTPQSVSPLTRVVQAVRNHRLLISGPIRVVALAVPTLFIVTSLRAVEVPRDLGIVSAVLAGIMVAHLLALRRDHALVLRAIIYVTGAFVVYLDTSYVGPVGTIAAGAETAFFTVLAIAVALTIRYSPEAEFRTTPMDYLLIFIVLMIGILTHNQAYQFDVGTMVIKLVILFYGSELIIIHRRSRFGFLHLSVLGTLVVLSARSLM